MRDLPRMFLLRALRIERIFERIVWCRDGCTTCEVDSCG
jgi:hypothetical protein